MKKIVLGMAAFTASVLLASPAFAALKVGDKAPAFTIPAATNGVVGTFSLKDALKDGPVVVYFYPKAFTGGCSLEAHQFSEAIPEFQAKHVSVVGISTDEIGTLQKFSKETCQGKFPVGADTKAAVTTAYDAKMGDMNMSNRISYVVGTDGKIAFVHADGDASTHVSSLLKAVGAAN
ncbi:MAG: redoxin domain-containing protein [Asticcacaulis sp.]|uniref:peroxiredoxin n=1 Tax=Asticcacaulis sp. TaxID=1872648 RepID=UPI0039E56BFE